MDPRVDEHARTIVEHCLDVQAGDEVVIAAPPEAQDLVVALHEHLGKRDAFPFHIGRFQGGPANRAFLRRLDPDAFEHTPGVLEAVADEVDCSIAIQATSNTHEVGDVSPGAQAAFQRLFEPVRDAIMEKRWVGTQYPASGNAQAAEMSTEAYADFVYDAVNKDWAAQREFQENLVEILDDASQIHIVSGDTTDVSMSVDGMHAVNDDGTVNLPGGEVFTAPVVDSVTGEVYFDMPVMWRGAEIEGVRLVFEDGEVVEHAAEKNEDMLTGMLDVDEQATRVGELGFGMNRDITQFTNNMLFDEKMGDTIHLALGHAYEETVGADREQNKSALHMDMIVDMSEDSYVEVDGEVIQRNGTFVFEDGFDEQA
jgi:aminopeptidase